MKEAEEDGELHEDLNSDAPPPPPVLGSAGPSCELLFVTN